VGSYSKACVCQRVVAVCSDLEVVFEKPQM